MRLSLKVFNLKVASNTSDFFCACTWNRTMDLRLTEGSELNNKRHSALRACTWNRTMDLRLIRTAFYH